MIDAGTPAGDVDMPRVVGPAFDVDEAVLGHLPHRLDVVREEGRRAAEQPLVPLQRRREVPDRDSREEVHAGMLAR